MIGFEIRGVREVGQFLAMVERELPGKAVQALREECEIELTEAKLRTPVDTGALRASGFVDGPFYEGDNISMRIVFTMPYAVYVHENLDAYHPVGQAKFLESVLMESAPHFADRVARRILQGL